jgi:CRP-like cAMP-binding protein
MERLGVQTGRSYATVPDNLAQVRGFANYTDRGQIRKYQKGESVILPGHEMKYLFFVMSGRLSLYMVDEAEQGLMIYALPYHVLDLLFSCQAGEAVNSHLIADENSTVCLFNEQTVLDLLSKDPSLLREFLMTYTSKVGYFMRMTFEKDHYAPKQRLLRFFRNLCLSEGQVYGAGYIIAMRLSQKTISEITGVHYISVSRIINELKRDRLITKATNKIVIHDFALLQDLISRAEESDS